MFVFARLPGFTNIAPTVC